jgi:Uma2 family endonuclease
MSIKPQVAENDEWFLEEEMPESQAQINLSSYLSELLKYRYKLEGWFVTGNLAIFPPDNSYPFRYIAPDIALFKGVIVSEAEQATLTRWNMAEPNRPAPTVVFEISSKDTWQQDLDPKPSYYHLLGVREYFAYDPQGYWPGDRRLRGWTYANNSIAELEPDDRGWLWSAELESYLVPDGPYLRLYDREGNIRLTEKEAANLQAELERAAKEAERAAKEAALQQAEAERAALQALLEKLQRNNIDPDNL